MDATELAREREAAAERTEKRRREEFVLVRARLVRRLADEGAKSIGEAVEDEYGHLAPSAKVMIVSAAEDPSYEGKVRRTRARWLLDEQRELGGEPVEGQLLARAAREWPSESEEEWAEIAKLAMALETGTIPAAEGEKKLLRSVPTKRMIELAAGFFVECPEATYQQAYDWIAENHGRPAIKYSSWQASSARKAKTLAKRRAGGETPAPTQAPAETAPAAPEAATVTEDDDGSLRIGYGPYELVATPIDAGGKRWLVSFRGAVDASLVHSLIGEMLGNPHLNKIEPAGSDA